jgi:hypothetical protein
MKIAERNKKLPELMEKLRETEEYKNYNLLTEYEPFVKLIAFRITQYDERFFITFKKDSFNNLFFDLNQTKQSQRITLTYITDYYYKKIAQNILGYVKLNRDNMYINGNYNSLNILKFICYLVTNGWNIQIGYAFDNVPLECSICSTSKDLKKCSCCEEIYCSTNCQIKNH